MSYLGFKEMAAVDVPTPPLGEVRYFHNVATGFPSFKDAAGNVHILQGAAGARGSVGPVGEEIDYEQILIPGKRGSAGPPGATGATGAAGARRMVIIQQEDGEEGLPGIPGRRGADGTGGGGGGSTFPQDNPFVPAGSPRVTYDYTEPGWVDVNTGLLTTQDIDTTSPSALYWKHSGSQAKQIYKLFPIPAGDFSLFLPFSINAEFQSYAFGGIGLTDGTADGAGNQVFHAAGVHSGYNGATWVAFHQTNTNFVNGVVATGMHSSIAAPSPMLRLTRASATYKWATSLHGWHCGRVWYEKTINPSFTPTHFGVMCFNNVGAIAEFTFDKLIYYPSVVSTPNGEVLMSY
jgi:hypothetical protein